MNSAARYILYIALSAGWVSLIYFLCLAGHVPMIFTTLLAAGSLVFILRKLHGQIYQDDEKLGLLPSALLIIGVVVFAGKANDLVTAYGEWDAWAIWNFAAKYLADADSWKNLFLNKAYAHTDYPLAVPSFIAFFARLIPPARIEDISFAFHFMIALCQPLLIYLLIQKRSTLIAAIALLLMVTNNHFIQQGVSQYADTLLAFFFLCAFVAIDQYWEDRRMTAIAGFMLGCCFWTKNEGVIIASIFILFYSRMLFHSSRIGYFIAGIAFPLIVWAFFKLGYAPGNDVLGKQGSKTMAYLVQPERYLLIVRYFIHNLYNHFSPVLFGLAFYAIRCIRRKQQPGKQVILIACCAAAYCGIYIITPQDLEWHLNTSQNRLMHQLMPSLMYVLAMQFSASPEETHRARGFSARWRPL